MRAHRTLSILAFVPFALVACGSSATTGGGSNPAAPTATATTAPATAAPTATPAAALIQTGQATVAGSMTTVLTNAQGMTLYYRTNDTATSVTCTGTCASAWPPVILPSGTPTGSSSVTGTLTVFAGPNGSQVEYNGHPLYLWAKDTAPGQATGEGVGGFKVAPPGLAA
jgi:predicted lipoprotein with Yx(FWY)xxD motif